jgi:hypothetical protein
MSLRFPARAALAASALALALAAPLARAGTIDLTSTADLLAGREPVSKDDAVRAVVADEEWKQHRDAIHAASDKLEKRLALTEKFRTEHLPAMGPGSVLLYPFSGPDFFNAYALFPDADTYVFFGLESPGEVPDLTAGSAEHRQKTYADLRSSLVNLIGRNFFITSKMMRDLHTIDLHGTTPLMLAMMGLLDLQVLEVGPYQPWESRPIADAANSSRMSRVPHGVRIVFQNRRTGRRQTLVYLGGDVQDKALAQMPDFIPWLDQYEGATVFLKAASYLLHGVEFKQVRHSLLTHARVVVQDDTGLPYKTLLQAGYEVTPVGQYEQPIKDFHNYYQADLAEAFEKSGGGQPLPFPFGYSWYMQHRSGLLIAVRPAAPPKAAAK